MTREEAERRWTEDDLRAEIERLRSERDEARRREREWHNASAQDRADNERLRATLQKADEIACRLFCEAFGMQQVIRAALEPKP